MGSVSIVCWNRKFIETLRRQLRTFRPRHISTVSFPILIHILRVDHCCDKIWLVVVFAKFFDWDPNPGIANGFNAICWQIVLNGFMAIC